MDSSRTEFYYNNKNFLEKRVSYDYKRVLKNGLGFKDDFDLDDFEKDQQWQLSSETFYSFDSLGRKIELNAAEKHWSNQNRFVWTYDDQNRISVEKSFDQERLIWLKEYNYYNNGYKYVLTWFDNEGHPKHLREKSGEYWSQNTCKFKLNSFGQEIEELEMTEKEKFIRRKAFEYDEYNRISKTVVFLEPNTPNMTHIYVYD